MARIAKHKLVIVNNVTIVMRTLLVISISCLVIIVSIGTVPCLKSLSIKFFLVLNNHSMYRGSNVF